MRVTVCIPELLLTPFRKSLRSPLTNQSAPVICAQTRCAAAAAAAARGSHTVAVRRGCALQRSPNKRPENTDHHLQAVEL